MIDAAVAGFDVERARYAIEQRCRADAILWRTACWAFPGFPLVAAVVEFTRAALQHRPPEAGGVLFTAGAALIGMTFFMFPMLRRRRLAVQALESGAIEFQANFDRMRRSSRNQRVLMQACIVLGGLGGMMAGIMAAVEGRWFTALFIVIPIVGMVIFARRHRVAFDEAFFAGRMSAEEWIFGQSARKRR